MAKTKSLTARLAAFIRDDSMSIALFGLFLLCIIGDSITGWLAYNQALREAHFGRLAFGAYLRTGQFLDGVFSNWQAAILQLAVLIAFGSLLRQKGAAHSRKPGSEGTPPSVRTLEWKFSARESVGQWLYANSLTLAFGVMFLASFAAHVIFGSMKHNEDQMLRHLPASPLSSYVVSPDFWSTVFRTWEAEFFAIGIYIVLSIFLRQEGSPESKPVDASDQQTGGANE